MNEISKIIGNQDSDLLPSFSVVIEWENARLTELRGAQALLAELRRQIQALEDHFSARPEILFVYNSEALESTVIETTARPIFQKDDSLVTLRTIDGPGLRYYEIKNLGAEQANGDIVIFVDTDVLPEDGWLRSMLRPFNDPTVGVVAGNTYVKPDTAYSQAFSLFWLFPLRANDDGMEETIRGFANNLAVRRDVFLTRKFPDEVTFRWQAGKLLKSLRSDGVGIRFQPAAKTSHLPPYGIYPFVSRALCQGHDMYIVGRTEDSRSSGLKLAFWCFIGEFRNGLSRIHEYGPEAGLNSWTRLVATGLMATYVTFVVIGNLITQVHPSFIRRYFSV